MKYLTPLLVVLLINPIFAQQKTPIFLGIQPAITKEKFYDKNEFDINVLPLVVQVPILKKTDLRATLITNYRSGANSGFSDLGIEFVFPYHFYKTKKTNGQVDSIWGQLLMFTITY